MARTTAAPAKGITGPRDDPESDPPGAAELARHMPRTMPQLRWATGGNAAAGTRLQPQLVIIDVNGTAHVGVYLHTHRGSSPLLTAEGCNLDDAHINSIFDERAVNWSDHKRCGNCLAPLL